MRTSSAKGSPVALCCCAKLYEVRLLVFISLPARVYFCHPENCLLLPRSAVAHCILQGIPLLPETSFNITLNPSPTIHRTSRVVLCEMSMHSRKQHHLQFLYTIVLFKPKIVKEDDTRKTGSRAVLCFDSAFLFSMIFRISSRGLLRKWN
jgi:hypothetical protein